MAIGIETPGQFAELAHILKKRRWQIVLPVAFCVAIAAAIAVFVPKKYEITTTVELRDRTVSQATGSSAVSTSKEITNAENHIKHFKRIRTVIEDSEWEDYELLSPAEQRAYIENVIENLNVVVRNKAKDAGSTFMDITFLSTDPERGEAFLSDLSRLWVDEVVDRERKALQQEETQLSDAVKTAKAEWQALSGEALDLSKEGFFSYTTLDATKENSEAAPEFQALNAQRVELEKVEAALAGAIAAKQAYEKELLETPEDILDTVQTAGFDPAAQILSAQSAIVEIKAKQRLVTPRHKEYKKLQDEIEELEEKIAQYKAAQRSSEVIQETRPNPARITLLEQARQAEVEIEKLSSQKLSLESSIIAAQNDLASKSELREQLYVKIKERDRLQEKHAELEEAHRAKKLQLDALSNEYGEPYEFVQEAVAPEKPSEPQPAFIILIGFALGLMIGVGTSVGAEFARDGFRTAADMSRTMNLPVLGVVQRIRTRRERAATALRRTVVGVTSLVLLVAIVGFTYLYTQQPELLPVEWVERLDELRSGLK